MSAKTKIIVLKAKEIVYTALALIFAIILILLFVLMFGQKGENGTSEVPSTAETEESTRFISGIYTADVAIPGQNIAVELCVDADYMKDLRLLYLGESVETLYPLLASAMEHLSAQICTSQSLEQVSWANDSQYSSQLLMDAIEAVYQKALAVK